MANGQFKMLRCAIAGVEAVEAETRHTFPRHTHEQFGIGVIHRGPGAFAALGLRLALSDR